MPNVFVESEARREISFELSGIILFYEYEFLDIFTLGFEEILQSEIEWLNNFQYDNSPVVFSMIVDESLKCVEIDSVSDEKFGRIRINNIKSEKLGSKFIPYECLHFPESLRFHLHFSFIIFGFFSIDIVFVGSGDEFAVGRSGNAVRTDSV